MGMPEQDTRAGRGRARALAAVRGLVSAAVGLGFGYLATGFVGPGSFPPVAVGGSVIDHVPGWLKDFAVATFGSNDKLVLIIGSAVVLAILAAVAGLLARRHLSSGMALVGLLGVAGVVAAATNPGASRFAWVPSVVTALAGAAALWLLRRVGAADDAGPAQRDGGEPVAFSPGYIRTRRNALATGGGLLVVGAAAAAGGGLLGRGARETTASRARVTLPPPTEHAPPLPAGYRFTTQGLTPYLTRNADFYRVDTDLALPRVPTGSWTLQITGAVDRPIELDYRELLDRPLIERRMTLCCVSNPIGGPYVGTARWLGVSLPALLREAGVRHGADQVLSRSQDGMTIGTPTDLIMDGREALLVVGMNGEPLPVKHGFPVRMLVPGLYGYASATKWLRELHLTSFAAKQAYWVERGYVQVGTARTATRIDLPGPFATVRRGPVTVAGVAWSPHRGISAVQYRVDGGPWRDARLSTEVDSDLWRQWRATWDATPGSHRVEARAADGDGTVQPGSRMGVYPSGATGWPSVPVTVED